MPPRDRIRVTSVGRRILLGALCAGMALAGCGTSRSLTTTSESEHARTASEPVPEVTIELTILNLLPKYDIPKRYTCYGANVPLSVQWSDIPSGTAELAMFVINLQPVRGRSFFDWAVAGISPTSHGISAATLPPGAVVARNSFGNVSYSICPAKGTRAEQYIVRLVALPRPLAVKPGIDAEALYKEAEQSAKNVGVAGGSYTSPRA